MSDPASASSSQPSAEARPSFEADIMPLLADYRSQMAWRFDLCSYADVKANALIIQSAISWTGDESPFMPPDPYPPFSQDFLATFQSWIAAGYPA